MRLIAIADTLLGQLQLERFYDKLPLEGQVAFILYTLLMVVSTWAIFEKAGEPGWTAVIPFVNLYFLLKVAGKPWWWLILLLIPLVNVIVVFFTFLGLSRNFGQGLLFALALFFLSPLFVPILAFGGFRYQPRQ